MSRMLFLRGLIFANKGNHPSSRPPQRHDCPVLRRLPAEIIGSIVEDLSALDKIVLAQSCSPFRTLLPRLTQTPLSASILNARDYATYSFRISRDDPDSWACDKCHAVHVFHPEDTPARMSHLSCPWSKEPVTPKERFFLIPHWPHYRHVQLALKLSRQKELCARQKSYLTGLLGNIRGVGADSHIRPSLKLAYESFPKIKQGKFLLKIVQHFEDPYWESSSLFLAGCCLVAFRACTHQQLHNEDLTSGWRHVRRRKHQHLREDHPQSYPILPHEEIETAVETAYTNMGEVVHRSCPQCPTDFTVQIWERRAVLCTWSDLGGEGIVDQKFLDAYRVQAPDLDFPYWEDGVDHESGSVRKLYELEEGHCLHEGE